MTPRHRRFQPPRKVFFGVGLLLGGAAVALALELPFVNWQPIAAPVDTERLVIRHDAKGDGRFQAPRSGNRVHRGVDLAAPMGSPVRAVRSGTVVQVGFHRGFGRYVELEHRGGLRSLYAHLKDIGVEAGQRVRQAAVIGTVGKTGNARHPWIAPHVHLELTRDGTPIDPASLGLALIDPELKGSANASHGG